MVADVPFGTIYPDGKLKKVSVLEFRMAKARDLTHFPDKPSYSKLDKIPIMWHNATYEVNCATK